MIRVCLNFYFLITNPVRKRDEPDFKSSQSFASASSLDDYLSEPQTPDYQFIKFLDIL